MTYEQILETVLARGSDNLHVFGGRFEGGDRIQQEPSEVAKAIEFLFTKDDIGISDLLEIGSASGGTTKLIADLLDIEDLYIIDDNNHPQAHLRSGLLHSFNTREFIGDSHSVDAIVWLRDQMTPSPDLVVVDGDHSYQGVLADIRLVLPFLDPWTYVWFHDTVACPEVEAAVNECERVLGEKVFDFAADNPQRKGIRIYRGAKE